MNTEKITSTAKKTALDSLVGSWKTTAVAIAGILSYVMNQQFTLGFPDEIILLSVVSLIGLLSKDSTKTHSK